MTLYRTTDAVGGHCSLAQPYAGGPLGAAAEPTSSRAGGVHAGNSCKLGAWTVDGRLWMDGLPLLPCAFPPCMAAWEIDRLAMRSRPGLSPTSSLFILWTCPLHDGLGKQAHAATASCDNPHFAPQVPIKGTALLLLYTNPWVVGLRILRARLPAPQSSARPS